MLRDDPSWLARFAAAQALSRYASPASAADLSRTQRTDASWSVRRQAAESAAARGVAAL
jgi:HEAT repeat protein